MKKLFAFSLLLVMGFTMPEYSLPAYAENNVVDETSINISHFSDKDISGTEWDYPDGIIRFYFTYPDGGSIEGTIWKDSSGTTRFSSNASYLNGGAMTGTIDSSGDLHFDPNE